MIQVEKISNSRFRKVTFSFAGQPGHQVSVAGSFNDWDPGKHPMTYSPDSEIYSCQIEIIPGTYEYKLVIDGEWVTDRENTNFSANDFGTLNSVLNLD